MNKLNTYNDIISDFQETLLGNLNESELSIIENDFVEIFNIKEKQNEWTKLFLSQIINEYSSIKAKNNVYNRKNSYLYNPLNDIPIKEPVHSKILAKLLNPNAEHGQSNLFLKTFLNYIKIKDPEKGTWIVTAETGRIDILLKRFDPLSIIIIENKSNDAEDQPNQLYRYWFQEIYKRKNKIEYPEEYFQIIYLPASSYKKPTLNSLSKPVDLENMKNLPDIIPIKPKLLRFNPDITNWLKNSLSKLDKENYRMKEFLTLYIELWN